MAENKNTNREEDNNKNQDQTTSSEQGNKLTTKYLVIVP